MLRLGLLGPLGTSEQKPPTRGHCAILHSPSPHTQPAPAWAAEEPKKHNYVHFIFPTGPLHPPGDVTHPSSPRNPPPSPSRALRGHLPLCSFLTHFLSGLTQVLASETMTLNHDLQTFLKNNTCTCLPKESPGCPRFPSLENSRATIKAVTRPTLLSRPPLLL